VLVGKTKHERPGEEYRGEVKCNIKRGTKQGDSQKNGCPTNQDSTPGKAGEKGVEGVRACYTIWYSLQKHVRGVGCALSRGSNAKESKNKVVGGVVGRGGDLG